MYFITKKHINRRTFLHGSSALVALPLLDAMIPALAKASSNQCTRLVCIEESHGLPGCNEWGAEQYLYAPSAEGSNYELVTANPLKSLEPWRDHFTIISNTDARMAEAYAPSEVGGDHFRSSAVFLTQSHPKQTQGSDLFVGTSIDQIHADRFGREMLMPSIQLCIEPNDKGGGCDYNYSCAYTDSISWKSPTEPLPAIRNPRTAFDMLFGDGGSTEERAARRKTQSSILDWVGSEVTKINQKLGAADQRRIDQYLTNVREIERRIQIVEKSNEDNNPNELPGAPAGVPNSYSQHIRLLFDLQLLAFQSDMTRTISLKTGRDASNRTFPESESSRAFHPASHHGGKEKGVLEFNKICQYRVSQLGYFMKQLEETNDGDSSLLDQSIVLWGSPMGDANLHNHRRCPLVLFGGANGKHKGGKHLKAKDGTPMANAMLTVLNWLGHEKDTFGDSTGELSI